MKSDDILRALDVGQKWTRQIKAEEKRPAARAYRETMYTVARTSLKEICYENMQRAWNKASDNGRLPTHWRQIFYVMRPLCDDHPECDRPLTDATFKGILESYLEEYSPGWDVLRGARGVFKEPHSTEDDHGLAMSTMNVRNYLFGGPADPKIKHISGRFPTRRAKNRIAAVLICEKEGFDELLQAEDIPDRYDLALMSTKGISAIAARDLAQSFARALLHSARSRQERLRDGSRLPLRDRHRHPLARRRAVESRARGPVSPEPAQDLRQLAQERRNA